MFVGNKFLQKTYDLGVGFSIKKMLSGLIFEHLLCSIHKFQMLSWHTKTLPLQKLLIMRKFSQGIYYLHICQKLFQNWIAISNYFYCKHDIEKSSKNHCETQEALEIFVFVVVFEKHFECKKYVQKGIKNSTKMLTSDFELAIPRTTVTCSQNWISWESRECCMANKLKGLFLPPTRERRTWLGGLQWSDFQGFGFSGQHFLGVF